MKNSYSIITTLALSVFALGLTYFSVIQMHLSIANQMLERSIRDYESLYHKQNDELQASQPNFYIDELKPHWFESPYNINLTVKQLEWTEFFNPSLETRSYRVLLLEQSIRMRPTWANAYFELHQTLAGQASDLGESEQILSFGSKYGPFEPSVNFVLIEQQLELWNSLSPDAKSSLLEKLVALLNAYYTHSELSDLIANSPQINRICSTTQFFNIWIPECNP